MPAQVIKIIGARQHNLKNLSVEIPREKLVVITGLSGSGKSSLAFDTLYAEGQRRYVESLSAYARQFLDKMEKPDVDFIEGLSPAIAIEQRSAGANPRSTIATTTEIYDYLRVLFSAVGQPHDPVTGKALVRQTPQQIVDQILAYPPETKIVVLAPIVENERGEFRDVIEKLRREGFVRARIDGEIVELGRPEPIRLKKIESHTIEAVVDRLIVRDGVRVRLADSIDTALKWGGNRVIVLRQQPAIVGQGRRLPAAGAVSDALAPPSGWEVGRYSTDYGNADSGFTLGELTPKHFSFNSHFGACPACHGLGTQLVVDPELMISEPEKSVAEGVITPWRRGPKRMQAYYKKLQGALVKHFRIDEEAPFAELPEEFKSALYFGTGETPIEIKFGSNGEKIAKPFEGLVPQMQRLYEETESEFTRNRIRSFMTREPCKVCRGARLRPEILAVTISAKPGTETRTERTLNIHQFTELTVEAAAEFISQIALSTQQMQIASEVVREIESRLQFLLEVGLGYLTLDRESGTLSGGEAQRIRLATQIGSGLAGVLYVLDEPSIGLHQRDNIRLLGTLNRLRDLGNSVIVVEHDEETIRAADHIIDLGPGAGPRGGEIVAQGSLNEILRAKNSITADYLSGRARIAIPRQRVAPRSINHSSEGWLTIVGASENN
ncbi:MAG: excinuclease ABC subunit A, partial [Verrucomicrobia bacterium]